MKHEGWLVVSVIVAAAIVLALYVLYRADEDTVSGGIGGGGIPGGTGAGEPSRGDFGVIGGGSDPGIESPGEDAPPTDIPSEDEDEDLVGPGAGVGGGFQ